MMLSKDKNIYGCDIIRTYRCHQPDMTLENLPTVLF